MTIWFPASKQEKVISMTEFCSWWAFSAEMMGAKVARGKWMRGKLPKCVSHHARSPRTCHVYVRNQVGLELVQVDVEGAIEAKGGCDRGNNLGNETVEVGEAWGGDVEALLADVVNGLVVDHE